MVENFEKLLDMLSVIQSLEINDEVIYNDEPVAIKGEGPLLRKSDSDLLKASVE